MLLLFSAPWISDWQLKNNHMVHLHPSNIILDIVNHFLCHDTVGSV